MSDLKPDSLDPSQQRQAALSRWDNEGGAGPCGSQEGQISEDVQSEVPELTNAELVPASRPRDRAGESGDLVARGSTRSAT